MSETIATAAFERATGQTAATARPLASGMSSTAWIVAATGSAPWVVRVPIPASGRRTTYAAEAEIGARLTGAGHPVAAWTIVEVDGLRCSAAPAASGVPIDDRAWTSAFASNVATVLAATHQLPHSGWGPLADRAGPLTGISLDREAGICDRWFLATIWPFDGTDLADHAVANLGLDVHLIAPDLITDCADLEGQIRGAGRGPSGVCHSDLHRQHLLTEAGRLTALLDFGDAFIGARAWDIALLLHYYGDANVTQVLRHYPDGQTLFAPAAHLAVAVALYKISKQPERPALVDKLRVALGRCP